jgi:ABC-type antimicrobial peptide transport system permease subunit
MYLPVTQLGASSVDLVVRGRMAPEAMAASVRAALKSVDATLPTAEFRTLEGVVERAVSPRRFVMVLLGGFAGLALLLASLGIYGVVSYAVTQRTQEIGIRMALGASAGQVRIAVMRQTVGLALAGAVIGTVGAVGVSRLIESLLFGVKPGDAATFAGVLVLLTGVAAVAGYLPARRASRIDPMVALRLE